MKIAFIFFLSFFACFSRASDVSRFCFQMGGMSEVVCNVPMSTLLARGEDFDGKIVIITGFYANSEMPLLFSNKSAFLSSDTANGLAITMPKDRKIAEYLNRLSHREVMLVARFSMTPVDVTKYQGYRTGGRLYDIARVGDAFLPWGFSEHSPFDSSKGE